MERGSAFAIRIGLKGKHVPSGTRLSLGPRYRNICRASLPERSAALRGQGRPVRSSDHAGRAHRKVRSAIGAFGRRRLRHRGSDPRGLRTQRNGRRRGFGPSVEDASSDVSFRQGLRTMSGRPTRLAYCPSGHHAKAVPFGGMLGMVAKDALGCPLRQYRHAGRGMRPFGEASADHASSDARPSDAPSSDGYAPHGAHPIRQEATQAALAAGEGERRRDRPRPGPRDARARQGTSVPGQRLWPRP
jgi:hypothetical protein